MNLVCRDRRSPEQRQSYVGVRALLRRSRSPILPLHHAVVRCGAAKRDPISLIVSANASKGAAPGDPALKMVYMRRLQVWACWLIVAAILIQPWNWVRIGAAVRSHRLLLMRCCGVLVWVRFVAPAIRSRSTHHCVLWEFGTTSGQLRERKNGFLAPKRHQMKHLDFLILLLESRRSAAQTHSPRPLFLSYPSVLCRISVFAGTVR